MRSFALACAILALAHTSLSAQDTKTPPNAKNELVIPGYKQHTIEGFKVLVSQATLDADVSAFERKPLDVLALELGMITKMFPEKSLKILRNLLIWIEWEEETKMANGRQGNALAVYYGGHQRQMLLQGRHPLKARTVTVLNMKSLTREHQPKNDSGRCVLLHEIAHAVHDQVLGSENVAVKTAYRLAMERNLYDKSLYVATNEQEFFAEATCMYFSQCDYFPKTRADLKKHDPATFKLMEEVWGKRAAESTPETRSDLPDVKLARIKLTTHTTGPIITHEQLAGKHVVVFIWHAQNPSSRMGWSKMQALDTELREFGLNTVGLCYVSPGGPTGALLLKDLGITEIPCYHQPYFVNDPYVAKSQDFPVALVFDPTGQLTFMGSAFTADEHVRKAIGSAIVAGLDRPTLPALLQPIADNLKAGKPPVAQLPKLIPLATAGDKDIADIARSLIGTITARAKQVVAEAETLGSSEPVTAFLSAELIAERYKGTIAGNKAADLVRKLKSEKAVLLELKARPMLLVVRKLDLELSTKPGSFDPSLDRFRRENAALLAQILESANQLRKTYPTTNACIEAGRLADKYHVLVPKGT